MMFGPQFGADGHEPFRIVESRLPMMHMKAAGRLPRPAGPAAFAVAGAAEAGDRRDGLAAAAKQSALVDSGPVPVAPGRGAG
jgi:hypothetical protein